jgi:hypothetical protein
MPAIQLPIATYDEAGVNAARLVNTMAEQAPEGAKAMVLLRHAPGVDPYYSVGTGPGQGLHTFNDVLYAVSGGALYRVGSNGAATLVGRIGTIQPVYQANNGIQHVIVAAGRGYVSNGTTLVQITDQDFRPAGPCAFLDNYILFVEQDTGRFFCSDLADATAYDGLDFATAEGAPDNLVALAVDHRQVLLFGEYTTEVWWDSGGTGGGFPFERVAGGFLEYGCAAAGAVTKIDNSVYWLANDRTARVLMGDTPVKVSKYNVERAWRGYARVDDCEAFNYTLGGHLCTGWRFPSEGACWIYDITTQQWHERESYRRNVWRVMSTAIAYDKVWAQDAETGAVGVLTPDARTEFGATNVCSWTYANVYAANRLGFHSQLQLVMNAGFGLVAGQGSEPLVRLEYSNDGGKSWRAMPHRSLGKMGKYRTRINWQRLGMGRDRVYRNIVSDPIPVIVNDAQLEVEFGNG